MFSSKPSQPSTPLLLSETSFTISPHLLPSHLASFSLTTTPTNLLSVLISVTKTDTPFVEQLAIVSILLPIITLPQQPQLLTPKSLFSPHAHITSHLHHPNVTELVGYCSEHGQHLLAYEFHKNGSLHDFLHVSDEFSKLLIWNSRVKIALGTTRALEYLHEVCSPSVGHKNIKSANISLDTELNPHLSDCGLASYIPNAEQILNHNVGSGYDAPEVALSGQYTFKSDIYSFGVVMLELLSGRKPFDSSRARPDQSLVRWATPQLHDIDVLAKMVDPALKGLYPVKSLSRFADVIALCAQPEPEFRPPMSEVVQALVRLVQRANMSRRTTFGSDHGGSLRGSDDPAIRDVQIKNILPRTSFSPASAHPLAVTSSSPFLMIIIF
ncbi:unnamed protein product [Vicia faba]|uniref:Protein kinase domain-containing protein n=1 Tax=Vicia faba TaxID=3906 RepID=A0AAV0Z290_VICFA|nr:unnamed protein product [Vicia faba]